MLKRMLILTMVFAFGLSGLAFAGAQVLSDKALDGVSAGDWVILKDSKGNKTVEDVYSVNNTLDLLNESQMDIKAISNANLVDSAAAVQTNVARVTAGGQPTENVAVYGINDATIANYRPADSSNTENLAETSEASNVASTIITSTSKQCDLTMDSASNQSASGSASASGSHAENETLDYTGSLAESGQSVGKGDISQLNIAASEVLDYDKVVSDAAAAASSSSSSSSSRTLVSGSHLDSSSNTTTNLQSSLITGKTETKNSTRTSKGANNHLTLLNTSQRNIQAVSNLNAVASGAAIQTNVTSNMGVSGVVSNSNTANVSSGF